MFLTEAYGHRLRRGRLLPLAILLLTGFPTPGLGQGTWYKTPSGCEIWSVSPAQVVWAGACASGRAEGTGLATWFFVLDGEQSSEHYEGQMLNGQPHGNGVYKYRNGDSYRGAFNAGVRSGSGEYYWADGQIYSGLFVDGNHHGRGVCTGVDGRKRACTFEMGEFIRW